MKNKNLDIYENFWGSKTEFINTSPDNKRVIDLINEISSYINSDSISNILDVGCGEGSKTRQLKSLFPNANIIGIDFTEAGIKYANENYKDIKNIIFKKIEADNISIYHNEYDLITCFDVLEHIENWKHVIDLFTLNAKYILISTLTGRMRKYEINGGHFRSFKKAEIENYLINKNYKIVKLFYAGFPFFNPVTRDLLNFVNFLFSKSKKHKNAFSEIYAKPRLITKIYSNIFYFLYKYCSTKNYLGNRYLGLFIKDKV